MTLTRPFLLLLLLLLFGRSLPAFALDCGRPADLAERSVCANPQLIWLDGIYNDAFHDKVMQDPKQADTLVKPWITGVAGCNNLVCLRNAYLTHIGRLYGADRHFDWSGVWWNITAPHGNSGRIQISSQNASGFHMNATVQGGIYQSVFNGEVRLNSGVGLTDKILWGGDCTIMLVPLSDGRLKVSSDSRSSCSLLLPGDMAIDGIYSRSDQDPRPSATLLSMGILPDSATDDAFHKLVGSDYQKYVDTATDFAYSDEVDNIGATVVSMWTKGMANRKAAMIVTTPKGQIWALRVEPAAGGKSVSLHYSTTEADKTRMPKTLSAWQARFIQPPPH